jgi:uncharacterized protein (TIGR02452 family)
MASVAEETLAILKAGQYTNPSGRVMNLGKLLRQAKDGTCSYPPEDRVPVPAFPDRRTRIEVVNASTLEAARALTDKGHRVAALNFASAKNPGGGFLKGARAQEESLARASGLYAMLLGDPMYDHHRARKDPMYTTWVIYSPDVPVFRLDEGQLLEEPYLCSFLTSPAMNVGALRHRDRRRDEIRRVMQERVERVLAVAALHRHEVLVLGAWGCGVFRNDPEQIAELFHSALAGHFRGAFTHVVFAVLDSSGGRHALGPFERVFGAAAGEGTAAPGAMKARHLISASGTRPTRSGSQSPAARPTSL